MENVTDLRRVQRKLRRDFIGYLAGYFLTFSAYLSMLNLQSSINVEDGLGTITVAVSYVVACTFLIFFTPLLLRKFGAKKCLIASELTYMIYVLANLYPEFYTLIPAAVVVGAGEAMLWPCAAMLNVHYAKQHAYIRKHPTKGDNFYVIMYSGYFFTAFQCCQVFGNILTYAVLYGFEGAAVSHNDEYNVTAMSLTTSLTFDEYEYCGAQDCQNVEVVGDSIDQYVPAKRLTIVILISILTTMCIAAQIIHCYFLPKKLYQDSNEMAASVEIENGCVNYAYDSELGKYECPKISTASDIVTHVKSQAENITEDDLREKFWDSYTTALKDLFRQMQDVRQLLLVPICLYVGFTQGFVFSELTRAYSSCVAGVAMVGIHMATYGVSDSILSFFVAKTGYKLGRSPFFAVSATIDAGAYCYCLLWNPNLESSWSIYIAFFAFGFSDGIWQTLLNVMILEYFPSSHDVAITMWSFWITAGISVQFAWSTALCVYVKIYIQFALLGSGMVCYGIAERIHSKLERRDNLVEETRL